MAPKNILKNDIFLRKIKPSQLIAEECHCSKHAGEEDTLMEQILILMLVHIPDHFQSLRLGQVRLLLLRALVKIYPEKVQNWDYMQLKGKTRISQNQNKIVPRVFPRAGQVTTLTLLFSIHTGSQYYKEMHDLSYIIFDVAG
jgi:hypothetical protein